MKGCYINTKNISICLAFVLFSTSCPFTQYEQGHRHRGELGFSAVPVYYTSAKSLNVGLHLHYVHYFEGSKFGPGAGYEYVFDEHQKTIRI